MFQVCGTLAKLLWAGLTHWVNAQRSVPNKKHIASYATQLCEYEVGRWCASCCTAFAACVLSG